MRLPGIANVHSHAFQRLLRGRVQARDPAGVDTFWTWREAMYALAGRLDLGAIEEAARHAFVECLESGYTAIGEFHYLHRGPAAEPWTDPLAASRALLRAARQSGIRITLLWTAYARGGFGRPLEASQRRFAADSLDDVRRALDGLAQDVDGERTALGLALHSVRALPREWLGPLSEEARSRRLPLHVHASEQRSEVDECLRETGLTPIGLLAAEGVLGQGTTVVHATSIDEGDLDLLEATATVVCICPTTEGDLADGLPRTAELFERNVPLTIGSDSHAVIDPFCELRMLEYQARATSGRRCVLVDPTGRVAPALLDVAHRHGYRALDLPDAGDFVHLDPEARALAKPLEDDPLDSQRFDALAAALLAGHPGLVRRVEVAGEVVVEDGRHVELGRMAAGR